MTNATQEAIDQAREISERLVVAGLRMQELAEEAEASRRRLVLLTQTGHMLNASMDASSMLAGIAGVLVPELGDAFAVHAGAPGSERALVAVPGAEDAARALDAAGQHVIATGRPLAHVSIAPAEDGEDRAILEQLRACGFSAVLAFPLQGRTHARGALTLLTRERRFQAADVTLVEEITNRVVIGIDRAALYAEAIEALRARDDLLAAVSHDLASPLNAIVFSVALLADAVPQDAHLHLQRIQRSADHMQHLIRDLVDGARIGAGALVLDRQPHPVPPLVAEAVDLLTPIAASRSIRIDAEVDVAARGAVANLDRLRVMRVLSNLIGNAIKFTPKGGRIAVHVSCAGGEVEIAIRDSGPGIAREDLPHLFDRFWQARRTAHLGAGLGLFIAQGIVAAHGGRIWVDSEVGAGSVFRVALPLAPAEV